MKKKINRKDNFLRYFLAIFMSLVFLTQICFAQGTPPSPQRTVLNVQVINATKDGTSVEGDEVTITVYGNQQPMFTLNGNVDPNGRVTFEDIPMGEGIVVMPRAKHQNMSFNGQALAMHSEHTDFNAKVNVYDVSFDNSIITVGTHHFILKAVHDSILIKEYIARFKIFFLFVAPILFIIPVLSFRMRGETFVQARFTFFV